MTLSEKEQRLENELREISLRELAFWVSDNEETLPPKMVYGFKKLTATYIRERRDERRRIAESN